MRVVQVYAQPLRSYALHAYHSAYVTLPHCLLLDTLAQAQVPHLRSTLLSPRTAHWGSAENILEAGSPVNGVAYSPNGHLVLAGTASGRLRVWTMVDFEEVADLVGHKSEIWSVAFSSDGLRIASGSHDRTLRVWDSRTFEQIGVCGHDDEVYSVAFSPNSASIASGSGDCAVRIWNTLSFEEVGRLTGHEDIVSSVAFYPDGTCIVSASHDCSVRIWDARTYESLSVVKCSWSLRAVSVSPDGLRLALGEHKSNAGGVLRMFDIATLVEQAQVNISPGPYFPWAIAFARDGDLIASGTVSGAVQIWDARKLSNISTVKEQHGQVMSIAFSPDGSQIVSGSQDGTVRIGSVASVEEHLARIPGHDGRVHQVVFSSDGLRLVSGSQDRTVRIWDGLSCEGLAVLTGHEGGVWTVAYSPDSARVISGSGDNTVRVWDALDYQEIAILNGHQGGVNFVTFAPDGTLIASCSSDFTVRLWSLSSLREVTVLHGHTDSVWSIAFSPAGTRVASISQDSTVRVWDAVRFAQLARLETHVQGPLLASVEFSLNGNSILTRFGDGPAWVSEDELDSKYSFKASLFPTHEKSLAVWTAVPFPTAPVQSRGIPDRGNGWLQCTSDHESGVSRIWLPAERRGTPMAVTSSKNRLVIGGNSGAMTMLSLSH
jgi:WD40 repeat protein